MKKLLAVLFSLASLASADSLGHYLVTPFRTVTLRLHHSPYRDQFFVVRIPGPGGSGTAGGGSGPAFVTGDCVALGTNGGTTPSFNATGGNAIIGAVFGQQGAAPVPSDGQGNTLNTSLMSYTVSGTVSIQIFYEENPSSMSSGHTLIISGTPAGSFSGICYAVLSGMKTSGLYGGTVNGTSATGSAACTPGSQAGSGSNVMWSAASGNGSTLTFSDGTFNSLTNVANGSTYGGRGAYKINAGTLSPSWTPSGGGGNTACSSAIFVGN